MARRAVISGTSKGHQTTAKKNKRSKIEAEWRRGNIADYEPTTLTDSGVIIFAELAKAMPDNALAKVDGYTIEAAADAIDKMRECRDGIDRDGMIVSAMNGNGIVVDKPNDLIGIYQRYSEIAKKYLVELGLTPSARSKIANDAVAKANEPKSIREVLMEDDED